MNETYIIRTFKDGRPKYWTGYFLRLDEPEYVHKMGFALFFDSIDKAYFHMKMYGIPFSLKTKPLTVKEAKAEFDAFSEF